jgi:hypothetical protein
MASKYKRTTIGSVIKSKDPTKANYIQIDKRLTAPVVLQAGQTVQVQSKKFQLESLDRAEVEGKLSGEMLANLRERANNIPDFVLGELVLLEKN